MRYTFRRAWRDGTTAIVLEPRHSDRPAANAGVAVGDRIKSVFGEPVSNAMEMFGPWRENTGAKSVLFKVQRDGKDLVLEGAKNAPPGGKGDERKGDEKEKNAGKVG